VAVKLFTMLQNISCSN